MLDLPGHLGKGGHARLIPLNASARQAVSLLLQFNQARGFSIAPEAPLLVNRRGQALPVRTFQHLVQRYREAAQLSSRITPHAFRHTMATDLVQSTGNLRVAQAVLGHARLNTVQVYTHPTPAELARALDTIG
jgi:integrase/recombinase XerC